MSILRRGTVGRTMVGAAAACLTLLPYAGCDGRHAETIVRFGADHAPPYTTVGSDGHVAGLSVDIINEAARRRGITVVWVPIRQGSVESALQSKLVDAWGAFSRTPERENRRVPCISEHTGQPGFCYCGEGRDDHGRTGSRRYYSGHCVSPAAR